MDGVLVQLVVDYFRALGDERGLALQSLCTGCGHPLLYLMDSDSGRGV